MVPYSSSHSWPNGIDLAATIAFLAVVLVVPIAGYVYMVLDFRAYLRSLRRGLILAARRLAGIPEWARSETPRSLRAMGLVMPCTEDDLMRAYRRRVKQLHPDTGGDQRRFLMLQAQFEEALAFIVSQSAASEAGSHQGA